MKIVVTGASGFIGRPLCERLIESGHDLTLLTRAIRKTASRSDHVRHVEWNPEDETSRVKEVDGSDAVINLAGEPVVAKRWTKKQKQKILTSRANVTQILVRSIQDAARKPKVLINASAIGFYGPRGSETLDEASSAGVGFLASTCKAWEAHAIRAEDFKVRVLRVRIGVVLGKEGGALRKLVPPFEFGAGGWLGSGFQWMSWIHLRDVVRLIAYGLEHDELSGALNATAPQPVTNKVFSLVLAQVLKRPCVLPVPSLVMSVLMGEMADELLLKGQRVIPKKAVEAGFQFRHPDVREALESILVRALTEE